MKDIPSQQHLKEDGRGEPFQILQILRDTLRASIPNSSSATSSTTNTSIAPITSLEDLIAILTPASSLLSTTSSSHSPQGLVEAIDRFLPSIQQTLLTFSIPTFHHLLDPTALNFVSTLFVSPPQTPTQSSQTGSCSIAAHIARITYLTVPSTLSTLPTPSRHFAISILTQTVLHQGPEETYNSLFPFHHRRSSQNANEIVKTSAASAEVKWNDLVRAMTSLPAKVANAVGKWSTESQIGGIGVFDMLVPDQLDAEIYFPVFMRRLEKLLFRLNQEHQTSTPDRSNPRERRVDGHIEQDLSHLGMILERLSAIGLFNPPLTSRTTISHLPLWSFFTPLFTHMEDYAPKILPRLLLPLPTSVLASFTDSLLAFIAKHTARLVNSKIEDVESGEENEKEERSIYPEQVIRRAADALTRILGPPSPVDDWQGEKQIKNATSEAWDAVVPRHIVRKWDDEEERVRTRIVVAWVGTAYAPQLIDLALDTWTDLKYIRYALYSQQFHLTHTLILALSLLKPHDCHLFSVSRRPRFLHAINAYLAHPDPKIRRLGMLIAEIMSQLTVPESLRSTGDGVNDDGDEDMEDIEALKAGLQMDEEGREKPSLLKSARAKGRGGGDAHVLRFKGMWQGTGQGKEECRWLRKFVGVRDQDAILDTKWLGWNAIVPEIAISFGGSSPEVIFSNQPTEQIRPKIPRAHSSSSITMPARPSPSKKSKTIEILDSSPEDSIESLDPAQLADPLQGYAPADPNLTSRTRAQSKPLTAKMMEEVRADPTLALDAAAKSKIRRPVYVAQLVELLKKAEKADEIECALDYGEGLVRAKRNFGTELSESAVDVARLAIGLNDQFNLENFEQKRQGLMTALVACSPRNVAPFLIELYFTSQYSLHQRSVMLTALAMGARELAGLPVPSLDRKTIDLNSSTNEVDISFPSKKLPARLHQRYATDLEDAIDGVRGMILEKGAKKGEEVIPSLARERRLRLAPSRPIREVSSSQQGSNQTGERLNMGIQHPPVVAFKDIAAEYFVLPMINRFWDHYKDATIRDSSSRIATVNGIGRGMRAGAGLVLSPIGLTSFLTTLALLIHAARHSPLFLAVLCPEAIELGITIGARHPLFTPSLLPPSPNPAPNIRNNSLMIVNDQSNESNGQSSNPEMSLYGIDNSSESQVLCASLELVLVSLDTAQEIDSGRVLVRDKPELILAAGEWAQGVFESTEEGKKVGGEGSKGQAKVRSVAAGVVVKVAELGGKWGVGSGWA